MDTRVLSGCIVALAILLGFELLTQLSGWPLDGAMRTPLGVIGVGKVLVTLAAMAAGSWVARRNFRWFAIALSVVLWVAVLATLHSIAPPHASVSTMSIPALVKSNALAIVLTLAASWFGAILGERLVARQRPTPSA